MLQFLGDLNPEGHPNCITGSKVTVIFAKQVDFACCFGKGLRAACKAGLFYYTVLYYIWMFYTFLQCSHLDWPQTAKPTLRYSWLPWGCRNKLENRNRNLTSVFLSPLGVPIKLVILIFSLIPPLGQFSLYVTMSVCHVLSCVVPSVQIFFLMSYYSHLQKAIGQRK